MKISKITILLILTHLLCLALYAGGSDEYLMSMRQDLKNYGDIKRKLNKRPNNYELQQEALTAISHAAFKVYFDDKMDIDNIERVLIYYTYIKQLQVSQPYSNEIKSYSASIINLIDKLLKDPDFGNVDFSYDLKLVYAESQLLYVLYESEVGLSIYRLFHTQKILQSMENEPLSFSQQMEQYHNWTRLDISNNQRIKLLSKINDLLDSYSAYDYYTTANTMLDLMLSRKNETSREKVKYMETRNFAMEKIRAVDFPDAESAAGREYELYEDNPESALLFYYFSAKKGSLDGKINAARLILDGYEYPNFSYKEAKDLLEGAQDEFLFDYNGGSVQLGRFYEYGLGVNKNDTIALQYYSHGYKAIDISHHTLNDVRQQLKERRAWRDTAMVGMNRIMNRLEIMDLLQYTLNLDLESMNPDQLFNLAVRYIILDDADKEIDLSKIGMDLMETAALLDSKKANEFIREHQRTPKTSFMSILNDIYKNYKRYEYVVQ